MRPSTTAAAAAAPSPELMAVSVSAESARARLAGSMAADWLARWRTGEELSGAGAAAPAAGGGNALRKGGRLPLVLVPSSMELAAMGVGV